jgi:hypothetical protein
MPPTSSERPSSRLTRLDPDRFEAYWDFYKLGETCDHRTVHERANGTTIPVRTITTCRRTHDTVYHFGTGSGRLTAK